MERSDDPDKMTVCKQVGCLLLMLFLGFLCCCPLITLVYFLFKTIAEGATSCTLWVDIPGRFAIFATCYYIGSLCGFFPLPQQYHVNSFLQPLHMWKLEFWRRQFRILCLPICSFICCHQRNETPVSDSLETPLLAEDNEERMYDESQWRRHSEPIDIRYPNSYVPPVFVSNSKPSPKNEIAHESVTSIGSSIENFAFPIPSGRSFNRYCVSDPSIKESPDDRIPVISKYRKKYTGIKWMDEDAANAKSSVTDGHKTIGKGSAKQLVKKSTTLTDDDERLKVTRRQKRRVDNKMRQIPMNTEANAAEERFRVPTGTTALLFNANNEPRMHSRIKQHEGTTVNYKIKSPPKYSEIYADGKESENNAKAPTINDHGTIPVRSRPLAKKCFALNDDKREATARKQEPTRSKNDRFNLQASDERSNVLIRNNRSNKQSVEATGFNKQRTRHKVRSAEAQTNFPGKRDKKPSPGKYHNNERPLNFPRFPWHNFRNPKGISACANKLHKKNMEREEREIKKYFMRQRRQTSIDRKVMDLLDSLRSRNEEITRAQLPRSGENISLIARSSFQMNDSSINCSGEQMGIATGSRTDKDKIGLMKKRYDQTLHEQQETENMEKSLATNQGPPLFSQRSDMTRKQDVENTIVDQASNRHRLPSKRFQIKSRSRSQIPDETQDFVDFKLEIHRKPDEKISGQVAFSAASSSNLSKFEHDTERTGECLRPVTQETAMQNYNQQQLEGLRRRLVPNEQSSKQTNIEISATAESKQDMDKKIKFRTSDTNVKDTESNVFAKPSEIESLDVKQSSTWTNIEASATAVSELEMDEIKMAKTFDTSDKDTNEFDAFTKPNEIINADVKILIDSASEKSEDDSGLDPEQSKK